MNAVYAVLERVLLRSTFLKYSERSATPFFARRLNRARVVWINEKWFAELGIDVSNCDCLRCIDDFLLDHYGFAVPRPEDGDDSFGDERKVFFADHYGDIGMVAHGGSGRAGTLGRIQVKGIGITPLVANNANWVHAHGCAWMEEAIREALYSELVDAEFPAGSLPIIAIIDTGLHAEMPKGHLGERRALILRDTEMRVAHLLRAAFFRPGEHCNYAQADDVGRVADAIAFYGGNFVRPSDGVSHLSPSTLLHSVAESIAVSEMFRLTTGGINPSSVTLSGRLLDFGSARALPDWRRAELYVNSQRFGTDSGAWARNISHIAYLLTKHGYPADANELRSLFDRSYSAAMKKYCLAYFGLASVNVKEEHAADLVASLAAIFNSQQKRHTSYVDGSPFDGDWIYGDLSRMLQGLEPDGRYSGRLCRIRDVIAQISLSAPNPYWFVRRCLFIGLRHSCPRALLYRETLQMALFESVAPKKPSDSLRPGAINDVLSHCLTAGRRHISFLNDEHIVALRDNGTTSIFKVETTPGSFSVYVSACVLSGRVRLGETLISIRDLDGSGNETEGRWLGSLTNEIVHELKIDLMPAAWAT